VAFIISCKSLLYFTVKPVLRGHLLYKENMAFLDRLSLKRGLIHMIISMTRQDKCDLIMQVTA